MSYNKVEMEWKVTAVQERWFLGLRSRRWVRPKTCRRQGHAGVYKGGMPVSLLHRGAVWLGDYKLTNVQCSSIADTGDDWKCKDTDVQHGLSSSMWGEYPRGWQIIKMRLTKKETK